MDAGEDEVKPTDQGEKPESKKDEEVTSSEPKATTQAKKKGTSTKRLKKGPKAVED